jgi:glycosyltransferase involved in cell wall biosynthesis
MKVALVSHTATIGGAELVLLELARGLAGRGVTVDVILPARGRLGQLLEAAGARTWSLAYDWWVSPAWSWEAGVRRAYHNVSGIWPTVSLLKRLAPDIVVTNTLTIPTAAVAAKALKIPHVWYLHEFGEKDHGLRFDLGFETSVRLINWLSARILVNSHALFDEFSHSIPARKLRVVYCAADVSPEPGGVPCRQDRPFRVVLVGNVTSSKGQEDAIRAVGLLRKQGREVRLALVGHCATQDLLRLRALAVGVRADELIDFIDFTEDRERYFIQSHAALMCSRSEAFGRVTVEAMKFGLPVIGANSGGTRELIRDEWNGLLYPPGDPAALAERIDRLYGDQALRARLGGNGKEWAQRTFSIARHTEGVMKVLAEILPAAI